MADYNAGSIEGTVTVNTDPFLAGLALAQSQADAFEDDDIEKTVRVGTEQTGNQSTEPSVHDETAKINLDDGEFHAKLDKDELELDKFGLKHETATVTINTNAAVANARKLEREIDNLVGDGASEAEALVNGGGGGGGHGLMFLIGLAAALAPALAPATAALSLFSAAGVAGFAALAVGGLAWGKVAGQAFGQIQAAIKAGRQLPGVAGQAETAFKKLSSAWDSFQKKVDPAIFRVMVQAFNTLSGLLPKLVGPTNAFSQGLGGALKNFSKLFDTKTFSTFLNMFESLSKTELPRLGKIGKNTVQGILDLFIALGPVIDDLTGWLQGVTKEFRQWANTHADEFIDNLLSYVQKYGPDFVQFLKDLGGALVNIGKGLGPDVGPAIDALDGLAKTLKNLDWKAVGQGISSILTSLTPFLPVLTQLANGGLKALSAILKDLSNKKNVDNIKQVGAALVPIVDALAKIAQSKTAAAVVSAFFAPFALGAGVLRTVEGLFTTLKTDFEWVKTTAPKVGGWFASAWDSIKSAFSGSVSWAEGVGSGIIDGIKSGAVSAWGAVSEWFDGRKDAIVSKFSSAAKWLKSAGSDTVNGIKSGASAAWDAVSGWFSDRKAAIQGKFSGASSWLVSHGKDILDGLKNGAKDGWDDVTGWVGARVTAVEDWFSGIDLSGAGKKIIGSFLAGLKAAWGSVTSWVSSAVQWVKDHFPGSPVKRGALRSFNNGKAGRLLVGMLADGLKAGTPALFQAATDAVTGLNDILSGAGSGVALGGGQYKIVGGSVMTKGLSDLSDSVDALSKQMAETTAAVNANGYTVADAVTASSRDHADSVVAGVAAATDKQTTVLVQTARTR